MDKTPVEKRVQFPFGLHTVRDGKRLHTIALAPGLCLYRAGIMEVFHRISEMPHIGGYAFEGNHIAGKQRLIRLLRAALAAVKIGIGYIGPALGAGRAASHCVEVLLGQKSRRDMRRPGLLLPQNENRIVAREAILLFPRALEGQNFMGDPRFLP